MNGAAIEVVTHIVGTASERLTLAVDTRLVPLPAIAKALYWLADRYQAELVSDDNCPDQVKLIIEAPIGETDSAFRLVHRSLLDFAVRERVEHQTGELRLEIARAAFAAMRRPT